MVGNDNYRTYISGINGIGGGNMYYLSKTKKEFSERIEQLSKQKNMIKQ